MIYCVTMNLRGASFALGAFLVTLPTRRALVVWLRRGARASHGERAALDASNDRRERAFARGEMGRASHRGRGFSSASGRAVGMIPSSPPPSGVFCFGPDRIAVT
jgi:hypothetical protein